jgi:hypothetical protein
MSSTDVRTWLREQGHDMPARGPIPAELRAEYDQAHRTAPAVIQGELIDDPSMGVTEADFPPDDEPYPDAAEAPAGSGRPPKAGRERRPRAVKPPPAKGIRERIFGGPKAGAQKQAAARGPRVSLSDWAEETWADLAWLAQPVPPLAKILTIQAPYAGVVFDGQVKGTVIDAMLQPVAKYSGAFRALNGLAGPPVYVGLICATGAREQLVVNGTPVTDDAGQPVMVYDARTRMLFQGLRYSLLQMTKIAEVNADEIRARTQASAERMAAVNAMIESIFGFDAGFDAGPQFSPPPAPAPPAGTPSGGGGHANGHANGYAYPDPSVTFMDGTGADPGRL